MYANRREWAVNLDESYRECPPLRSHSLGIRGIRVRRYRGFLPQHGKPRTGSREGPCPADNPTDRAADHAGRLSVSSEDAGLQGGGSLPARGSDPFRSVPVRQIRLPMPEGAARRTGGAPAIRVWSDKVRTDWNGCDGRDGPSREGSARRSQGQLHARKTRKRLEKAVTPCGEKGPQRRPGFVMVDVAAPPSRPAALSSTGLDCERGTSPAPGAIRRIRLP